ncbi:MAG: serine hydrolase [Gemmatimonadota bacterium]|nr:serine hydrolase [Gemmatimonadota bacterium]MDE3171607.1 serine hydrolase [Gemmatimonadota bacterium]
MFLNTLFAVLTLSAARPAAVADRPGRAGLPPADPAAVGMSADRLAEVNESVIRGIRAGAFPGASVFVGRQGYAVVDEGFGHLTWSGASPLVVPNRTIYDLASLTKVIATTTAIMVLYDEGKVRLDDPVYKYLPEFSGGLKDRVTVRMLLEHRSGLPAGRELWRTADSPAEARAQVLATHLYSRPGARYVYSDLGADVLGFIVEAASGETLDRFVQEHVFQPLGMNDTEFRPDAALDDRIAPTAPWSRRGEPLQGQVNDDNAEALGGVAGHAGLFSTASDLAIFAQMMLNGGEYDGVRIVADSTVKLFTTRAPHAGTRALGWDTCDGEAGCGDYMGSDAFGHTGFTGTSIWIDPDRQMFVILLTNRVYDPKIRHSMKAIADVRADLADASVLSVNDAADGGALVSPASWRTERQVGWNRVVRRWHHRVVRKATAVKKQIARPRARARKSGA